MFGRAVLLLGLQFLLLLRRWGRTAYHQFGVLFNERLETHQARVEVVGFKVEAEFLVFMRHPVGVDVGNQKERYDGGKHAERRSDVNGTGIALGRASSSKVIDDI